MNTPQQYLKFAHRSLVFGCIFITFILVSSTSAQSCSATKKCDTDACCSQWGHCGYGPDFCGKGCKNNCNAKPECGLHAANPECPLKVCCSKWGFCGTTEDFCNAECQNNCEKPPPPSCSGSSSNKPLLNIGYYASWAATRRCNQYTVDNIDPRNYTHLNYAFVEVKDGVMATPTPTEDFNLRKFAALRNINPNLQVLASVGGWAFNDPGPTQQEFHNIVLTRNSRKRFIKSVMEWLEKYEFDGIDIDYEYPVAEDRGGSPEDKENFIYLVEEMRKAFRSRYLITIAAPASYWYLRHFEIAEMSKSLDWINVMTYDIHGAWDANISALGPYINSHTDIREIQTGIDLYRKDGVPDNKIVLGTGFYGRSFTLKSKGCNKIGNGKMCEFTGPSRAGECTDAPGTLAWFEIEDIIKKEGVVPQLHKESMSKVLTFGRDQWVAYDDDETLEFKKEWARKNCMRGTMIWSIDQGLEKRGGEDVRRPNVDGSGSVTEPRYPNKSGQYGKPGLNGNQI